MRRTRGTVGTRPGRSGLWMRWVDSAGKRRLRKAVSSDSDDAVKELQALIESVDEEPVALPPTLDAFLADTYIPIYRQEVAASTFTRSKPQLDRLSLRLGAKLITEIKPTQIRAHIAKLRESGLSSGTLRREVAVIRPVFEAAVDQGLIIVNPVRVKVESPPPRRPPLLPNEKLDAVLAQASLQYRPYLTVLIDTGLRRTTAIELTWDDITEDLSALIPNPGKNAKRKIPALPLTDRVRELLRAIRATQDPDEPRVFPRLTENGVRLWWQRFRRKKAVDLATWRLHDFRHQFGSTLAQARVPLPVVADLLGHANARLVAEVYGTSSPSNAAADAIRQLQEYRRPVPAAAKAQRAAKTGPAQASPTTPGP